MKFIKKLFSYAIGNGLSKMIAVIILPIYTNYLNPSKYGQIDLIYYTVSIIVSFVFMECWTGLLRFIYDDYSDSNRKKVLSNTIVLCALLLIPYIIIQYIVSVIIAKQFAIISCVYGIVYMILQVIQIYARAIKKSKEFVISGIINSLIQLVVAYIAIVQLKLGEIIVIIAPILGAIIACLYLIIKTKCIKEISFKLIDKSLLKKMYLFCIPLAFNSVAFWAMNNINRYLAAYFLDFEASSFVSIASKLTMIITLAASVYSLAWQEDAFEKSKDNNKKEIYDRMFKIYISIFSVATAFSMIFVKLIFPIIIGQEYSSALDILPLYFVAVYFSGISSFLGQIFGAEKNTKMLLLSTIVGTIANLIIVPILINKIGIMIIPVGSLIGYLTCTIMRHISLHKITNMAFNIKEIAKAMLLVITALIMFYFQYNICYFIVFGIILLIISLLLYKNIIKELITNIKGKNDESTN